MQRVAGGEVRTRIDHLFRHQAGQMISSLTRILGINHLDLAEDVVQDALLQALRSWPYHGVPDNPSAWIVGVARNRALDALRRQAVWGEKEELLRRTALLSDSMLGATGEPGEAQDDQLSMIFACCHPTISRDAQVALTLKVVGGFSVPEIARAFLSPPSTIAQRIVRAKRKLRAAAVPVEIPGAADLPSRLDAVLEVLYLMFNEGYDASQGDQLVRRDLCQEALRLVSLLAERSCTATPRTHALAALLFFQGGRLAGRMDAAGEILLLEGQDRSRWDRSLIGKGAEHMARSAEGEQLSAYHLEAEIASCHALAPCFQETDWVRILSCYDALYHVNPSPVVALNRIVAVWQVHGAESAWQDGRQVFQDPALRRYASTYIVKGQLLGELDRFEEAQMALDRALEMSVSDPVRRFLVDRRNHMTERVTID